MIAELRSRSQITVPKEIVSSFGLKEGDRFEVFERDGAICFMPVVVYPKKYVAELQKAADETLELYRQGKAESYSSAKEAIAALHLLAEGTSV